MNYVLSSFDRLSLIYIILFFLRKSSMSGARSVKSLVRHLLLMKLLENGGRRFRAEGMMVPQGEEHLRDGGCGLTIET